MKNYINIYNNLIKLTRNKLLYLNINKDETFSERLIFFLLHFSFFLKIYKNEISKKEIQEIYDFIFRQLELSIREIGYGDVSINKKMKDYINFLHKIIGDIDNWDELSYENKMVFFSKTLNQTSNTDFFVDYFDKYLQLLKKNTLNSFINNIIDLKF
tara:strand:- start:19 stop:489 length:471 start_codon:yes stop_codon:yes gene_type:complete